MEQGDWVVLGAADEKKPAAPGTVEAWGRSPDNPVGGWYGLRNGYRGRFGMYLPPLLEALGLAELTHDAAQQPDACDLRAPTCCTATIEEMRTIMTVTKVIRYTTKPECADENERLIRGRLRRVGGRRSPMGLHYATFRLDDGVSFLHVAVLDGEENPLTTSAAFAAFQADIKDRLAEGPIQADATPGSYRMLSECG